MYIARVTRSLGVPRPEHFATGFQTWINIPLVVKRSLACDTLKGVCTGTNFETPCCTSNNVPSAAEELNGNVQEFPKLSQSYYALLECLAQDHMPFMSRLDPTVFLYILSTVSDGLTALGAYFHLSALPKITLSAETNFKVHQV